MSGESQSELDSVGRETCSESRVACVATFSKCLDLNSLQVNGFVLLLGIKPLTFSSHGQRIRGREAEREGIISSHSGV